MLYSTITSIKSKDNKTPNWFVDSFTSGFNCFKSSYNNPRLNGIIGVPGIVFWDKEQLSNTTFSTCLTFNEYTGLSFNGKGMSLEDKFIFFIEQHIKAIQESPLHLLKT